MNGPPSPGPLIECVGLTRTYDLGAEKVKALRDATFEVGRGEFVAIMGASGSGKSTLLNILGTLDRPTAGEYFFDGRPLSRLSSDELAGLRNREIGFVFQQFNLLPRMTALENVALPLAYSAAGGLDRIAAARARLDDVGLGARLRHFPNQLSGGQQQRVAIARALVNSPGFILADEPTGALDTRTTYEIMALFARLHAQGLTLIIVTHEPDVAAYAERVLLFRDGLLVSDVRQTQRATTQAAS